MIKLVSTRVYTWQYKRQHKMIKSGEKLQLKYTCVSIFIQSKKPLKRRRLDRRNAVVRSAEASLFLVSATPVGCLCQGRVSKQLVHACGSVTAK